MIRDFDSFCMLMDALWMMKLVTDRARAVTFYQIKRTILITCGRIRTLVYRAQASSQRSGAPDPRDPRIDTPLDPVLQKNPAISDASKEPTQGQQEASTLPASAPLTQEAAAA